jgi:hypothetical protein
MDFENVMLVDSGGFAHKKYRHDDFVMPVFG